MLPPRRILPADLRLGVVGGADPFDCAGEILEPGADLGVAGGSGFAPDAVYRFAVVVSALSIHPYPNVNREWKSLLSQDVLRVNKRTDAGPSALSERRSKNAAWTRRAFERAKAFDPIRRLW